MKPARIVIKHRGFVLMDIEVRALLYLMRYQRDLESTVAHLMPDDSTTIETHTDQFIQSEPWLVPDEDEDDRRYPT